MDHMSDEERARLMVHVDHFIDIIESQSGLRFDEVVDILKWARRQKAFHERLVASGLFAAIGTIVTAALYALWKGLGGFHIDP